MDHIQEIMIDAVKLLSHNKKSIRKMCCDILSSIASWNHNQIELLLANPLYVKEIINIVKNDAVEVTNK